MESKEPGREEEAGFRVTDRRRMEREESPGEPQAAEAQGARESPPADQPEAEAPGADIGALPVADLVRVFIAELHARAWIHLGLVVNPATNLAAKDLAQARLAIDCIGGLVEHLGSAALKGEQDELEGMLADLRINFVRQGGL